MKHIAALLLASSLTLTSFAALADPPAHAPAHGWRKKHDPNYVGYSGARYEEDFEVSAGRCNREAIGAAIGGVAGGALGSTVANPEHRTVGIIVGATVGALIGARIGRNLDEGDRGCFGHALELARPGGRVMWDNPATGVSYVLQPGNPERSDGGMCRKFTLSASAGREKSTQSGKACQKSPGVWRIV